MQVLVIEDDERLADTLGEILKEDGYHTDLVYNGEDGYEYACSGYYDVILLDVMLPKMNGYEVVSLLREKKVATPVLMLTAKDEIRDKVKGLDAGADDYLTKPFVPDELLARIRALSRRQGEVILDTLEFDDLTLNLSQNELECGEKAVRLSTTEVEMMKMLMKNGKIISKKEDIILNIWGCESDAVDNNVEVFISFIRKKLKFIDTKVSICTARKAGYYLDIIS